MRQKDEPSRRKGGKGFKNTPKAGKYLTKNAMENRLFFTNFDFRAKYLQSRGGSDLTN
jgi:hypothetical protein